MSQQATSLEAPAPRRVTMEWLAPSLLVTVALSALGFVWQASQQVDDMRHLAQTVTDLQQAVQQGRADDRRVEADQIIDLKAQITNQLADMRTQADDRARADDNERRRISDLLGDMQGKQIRLDSQLSFLGVVKDQRK